jgi:glycosyltransferase involved in cell wall biosynthesis
MDRLTVAIDVGALHGHRTGVGTAVHHMVHHLEHRPDVELMPYLVSFRARPIPPQRRLPIPAALAVRAWARSDHPRADRWLAGAHVVHGPNYVVPPSGLPTVVSVYDCWSLAHPDLASPAVRRAGAVLRRAVARGAWVHVSSHATAALASDLLGTDRIAVVHLGPPDPPPATTPPATMPPAVPATLAGRPYVVCVGTLERRKDVTALVRAFGAIAHRFTDLHLVIVGAPGDDSSRVAQALDELPPHIRSRALVTGVVDAPTKAALLDGALALAYPSLDEGFGFPILEAQQAGTAVVARAAGSIPEVGGDGVHLAESNGIDDLADALAEVVADDRLRADLVAAGHHNLSRFSWSDTADGLVNLYRRASEDHR